MLVLTISHLFLNLRCTKFPTLSTFCIMENLITMSLVLQSYDKDDLYIAYRLII